MNDHVETLEPKIRALQAGLNKIALDKRTEQLLVIIHKPGWTTPQEIEFVHAALDSLAHQIEGVDRAHEALVTIADKIGSES